MRTRKKVKVQVNDVVNCVFPGWIEIIPVKITEYGYKKFKNITRKDALREGYASKQELIMELLEFYPYLKENDMLYYYRFELVGGK